MTHQLVELITNHGILSTLFALVVVLLLVNEGLSRKLSVMQISPEQVVQWMNREGAVLLDIRADSAFALGHILGSESVSSTVLDKRMPSLMKYQDKPIVVVCNIGQTAASVGKQLSTQGFKKIMVLSGGIQAWKAQGLPLVKS
jgi:rhodanese-related sulfurtransferase